MRIFSGLISRWVMPIPCMYSSPSIIWWNIWQDYYSDSLLSIKISNTSVFRRCSWIVHHFACTRLSTGCFWQSQLSRKAGSEMGAIFVSESQFSDRYVRGLFAKVSSFKLFWRPRVSRSGCVNPDALYRKSRFRLFCLNYFKCT